MPSFPILNSSSWVTANLLRSKYFWLSQSGRDEDEQLRWWKNWRKHGFPQVPWCRPETVTSDEWRRSKPALQLKMRKQCPWGFRNVPWKREGWVWCHGYGVLYMNKLFCARQRQWDRRTNELKGCQWELPQYRIMEKDSWKYIKNEKVKISMEDVPPEAEIVSYKGTRGLILVRRNRPIFSINFHQTPEWPQMREFMRMRVAPRNLDSGILVAISGSRRERMSRDFMKEGRTLLSWCWRKALIKWEG